MNVVRFLFPLTVEDAVFDEAVGTLVKLLKETTGVAARPPRSIVQATVARHASTQQSPVSQPRVGMLNILGYRRRSGHGPI